MLLCLYVSRIVKHKRDKRYLKSGKKS